jgi:GMP reductase
MSLFSYDTVTLIPQGSSLESRANADTSVQFLGYSFKLPVVPANMIDVISFTNAQQLDKEGYAYIMHRFNGATPEFIRFATENSFRIVSVSVGTQKL